jgi:hypothetical protein
VHLHVHLRPWPLVGNPSCYPARADDVGVIMH